MRAWQKVNGTWTKIQGFSCAHRRQKGSIQRDSETLRNSHTALSSPLILLLVNERVLSDMELVDIFAFKKRVGYPQGVETALTFAGVYAARVVELSKHTFVPGLQPRGERRLMAKQPDKYCGTVVGMVANPNAPSTELAVL